MIKSQLYKQVKIIGQRLKKILNKINYKKILATLNFKKSVIRR